ncbi:abl interactor 1-like isoform X2 [Dreissena polymorpha]|uniref:abl interactor 1-like isoform X2 n=1 Tax=Dreissena polymorpha TaxID=45954 RepID=UPI00226551CD|nr:abl interactor 1-like isoform X2 [Dreissena polymorpha]
MSELLQLIDHEIPDGRRSLQENFNNLEQVAQYCQENYLNAKDKRKALEETKNFTTHSLASVAYQINNLATNFLKLLDLQQNQLAEMESNVNHLAQTVNIHKEKVARREIGVLTTNRTTTRPVGVKNGIIFPEQGEKPTKYQRKNIDYSVLDDIGHGVKSGGTVSAAASSSGSRHGSISSMRPDTAPSEQPPTPPQPGTPQGGGSLSRALGTQYLKEQGPYRTPAPAVAPPTVPGDYMSREQMMGVIQVPGSRQFQQSPYAPSAPQTMMGPQRLPPGMGMPYAPGMGGQVGVARPISSNAMPPPPPTPGMMQDSRMSQIRGQTSVDEGLPPPPTELSPGRASQNISFEEEAPLPPAPEFDAPPPQFDDEDDDFDPRPTSYQDEDQYATAGPHMFQSYVPDTYLEKVIAIFDYMANKDDELSFKENSVLYVLKKNDDGWFEGILDGVTGLFPGNYVEACM